MSSPSRRSSLRRACGLASALTVAAAFAVIPQRARGDLPQWMQHVVGASTIEAALYRVMALPAVQALYPRPPKESQAELAHLIAAEPNAAELYALRAHTDEEALDFSAAESDWKLAVAHASDPVAAQLQLADFYQRRLQTPQEIATLSAVAAAPASPAEAFTDPPGQRSWQAFDRLLALIADQGLPPAQTAAAYQAFLTRYPDQPAVYARALDWQLQQKAWPDAEALIARFHRAFPNDQVFPVRARAQLELRRGNIDQALTVYDRAFDPLWPAPLVEAYYNLLAATHRQRAFVADARARLAQHPDGPEALNAVARIFFYDQQAGRLDKAQQTLDAFRIAREARNAAWTPADLYTLASLSQSIHSYPEAARFRFALASTPGALPDGEPAAQAGLSGLIDILLTAPDEPIALGAGNLTLYRDIATVDPGPGYWNGILSLWLNGASPQSEYQSETAKAQAYFHRAKAAELLAELDRRFPAAPRRPALHAAMIHAFAQYGEPAAVVASGKEFLTAFPASPQRVEVAGLMADAYARQQDEAAEFALYDSLLAELAARTGGMPLSAGAPAAAPAPANPDAVDASPTGNSGTPVPGMRAASNPSIQTSGLAPFYLPTRRTIPEATAYAALLDRYLGRLVASRRLPQALTVLRRQLDLNPDDPRLYERLADFLQQNNLSAEQEEVFKLAYAHFQQPTWYDKLARLYLRERNREALGALTRQVTDIFSGTDLDAYFRAIGNLSGLNRPNQPPVGPQLAMQLNLYAAKRFPHDLIFTRNLLAAYNQRPTSDPAAYDDLLRRHWWESDDLRATFFAYLSRTGKLQSELDRLQALDPAPSATEAASAAPNPAAARELAELNVWGSHFEQAAPLLSQVVDLYPADASLGDRTVSLFRSLAYLDPSNQSTQRAVAIEQRLLAAAPDSPGRLAALGDLYAEARATGGEDIAAAAPFWRRIPALHPGTPAGLLTSATIFWDYFQFDDALAQIHAARTRFQQPTLFGFEAGAIHENRHDLPAAIAEYTAAATRPVELNTEFQLLMATIDAAVKPPSDPADSNLWSTGQALFGSDEAQARLLKLAARPDARALVDSATARAALQKPMCLCALILRAGVLNAQHRDAEIAPLLDQALNRTATTGEAASIAALAQQHVLVPVYEHALAREAALASDPVQKIELNYTLARSLEDRKDLPGAAKVIDAVYRANPRILGVVRASTDFYARTQQPPRAIATLLEAAHAASPGLSRSFTLEAAQRANDSGNTAQARALATPLLTQTPYDAAVLGLIATSYARAGDDAGLRHFYEAQLAALKSATLPSDERRRNTALLRRGLIPALTRMKDFDGGLAQYIALLSAYPEDSSTAQEAALYALRYGRQPQLLDFLNTTVKDSPRDSRFAILLAQVETTFEDLPAAVAAYTQAIAIRKDRADLYSARADLELRLGLADPVRNDAAAADFERLYVLSYKDPAWMLRLAELRARQQRPAEAVKALETAWITGQTPSAANQFRVAGQLAEWNLLEQARGFAEQGIKLAGPNLLTLHSDSIASSPAPGETAPPSGGAATYARIMARLGRPEQALRTLVAARHAVESSTAFPAELAARLAAADLAEQRAAYLTTRRATAAAQLDQALQAIGAVVQTWYTPDQKLTYAQVLDTLHDRDKPNSDPGVALSAATFAGLTDREAEWRKQLLLNGPVGAANPAAYTALQRRRLAFPELARTLEAFAARLPANRRHSLLLQAAQAWRNAGDETSELRLTRTLALAADPGLRDRFFDLLLRHDRAALIALASSRDATLADAALNYAVAHATETQAMAAVAQRGRALPPVWRPAAASLVLTSFASNNTAQVAAKSLNFTQALNSEASIADRLAAPADPARVLTGDLWFYYASRFGIFLQTVPRPAPPRAAGAKNAPPRTPAPVPEAAPAAPAGITPAPVFPLAEDLLPAELERAPSAPAGYLHLARTYAEAGDADAALAEYGHALELAPADPALHDELAAALYKSNRDDALTHWKTALTLLRRNESGEAFFSTFTSIARHLGDRRLIAGLRPELEAVLRPYFARNGNYRSNELLQAVYQASASPAEGTAFVLAVIAAAPDPNLILDDLHRAPWLAPESHETILLRQIELARQRPQAPADSLESSLLRYQNQLIDLYLDRNETARALQVFDSISAGPQRFNQETNRIILAVRTGRLQTLLDGWRDHPDAVPPQYQIDSALFHLRQPTPAYTPDPVALRPLIEFVFEHKQLQHTLQPVDFVTLAQSRLDTADLPGALEILRRLTLQPVSIATPGAGALAPPNSLNAAAIEPAAGATEAPRPFADTPFANTDYAASLLESTHHPAEALPFLKSLVESVPWYAAYRLRLAEAQRDAEDAPGAPAPTRTAALEGFESILQDASAPYAIRVRAARDIAALGVPLESGANHPLSPELTLLASANPTPLQARQPFFAAARLAAAASPSTSGADRIALLREAIAIEPYGAAADQARLDLLLAADSPANAGATLALFAALQNGSSAPGLEPAAPVEAEADAAETDAAENGPGSEPAGIPTAPSGQATPSPAALPARASASLDLAGRIRLASVVAAAYQRDDQPDAALTFLQLAVDLDRQRPEPDAALAKRLATLKSTLELERRNAARRPLLRAALDQPDQVRPRLTLARLAREEAP